jgi:hypothetical protein
MKKQAGGAGFHIQASKMTKKTKKEIVIKLKGL